MKRGRSTRRSILGSFSAAALAFALGACASSGSSGQRGAEKTVARAEKLSAELTQLGVDFAAADAAIDALRGSVGTKGVFDRTKVATGDINASYQQFRAALDDARDTAEDVTSANVKLKESMTAYVQAWEADMAQVQSENLREASMERRAKAQERFEEVAEKYAAMRERIEAHLKHLGDIELALGAELTPAGISAIDDDLGAAKEASAEIAEDLSKATERLATFAESLRTSVPPPPPAEPEA